eukprot:6756465-Prorocentrum_lima.AAC.1
MPRLAYIRRSPPVGISPSEGSLAQAGWSSTSDWTHLDRRVLVKPVAEDEGHQGSAEVHVSKDVHSKHHNA